MRIGVAGIAGRMGVLTADAVLESGLTLVGGTVRGRPAPPYATEFPTMLALAQACDVVIDFTHAETVVAHARDIRAARTAWVLGTTGLSDTQAAAMRAVCATVPVVQAANFSPGVTLLLGVARYLAGALPAADYDAEILEMHHRFKADAPSGTALALGRAVAEGRGASLADIAQSARHGQTGPRPAGAIGFASLRGGGVIGDHTLLFAGLGEHISLSHHAIDRAVFARGAVRAAIWAGPGRAPGLYGMEDVLGLPPSGLTGDEQKGQA
jgi:4-hydroxy-tetrahydrodipicolinate reductase